MTKYEEEEDVVVTPRRRKVVEDEEEEVAPTSRRKPAPAEEDEAPKKAKVAKDEDEEKPATRRKAVKDDDEDDKPSKAPKGQEEEVGIDVDFGDERVTKFPGKLERLKLDGANTVRFAFIPGFKVKAAFNHYVEGQGTFVCNSTDKETSLCCQKLGNPGMRAVALVVHYENAKSKDGSMPKDGEIEWSIKYLRMSRTNFAEISRKKMEDETLYDFDLTMSAKPNDQIGFSFEKISKTAWWRKDEDLEAEIMEAAEKFRDGKALSWALGKKIDELEYKIVIKKAAKDASKKDEEEEI